MSSGNKDSIKTSTEDGSGNGAQPPSFENNGGGDNGGGDDEGKEELEPELLNLAEVFSIWYMKL